jgi:hypothetical protein
MAIQGQHSGLVINDGDAGHPMQGRRTTGSRGSGPGLRSWRLHARERLRLVQGKRLLKLLLTPLQPITEQLLFKLVLLKT